MLLAESYHNAIVLYISDVQMNGSEHQTKTSHTTGRERLKVTDSWRKIKQVIHIRRKRPFLWSYFMTCKILMLYRKQVCANYILCVLYVCLHLCVQLFVK